MFDSPGTSACVFYLVTSFMYGVIDCTDYPAPTTCGSPHSRIESVTMYPESLFSGVKKPKSLLNGSTLKSGYIPNPFMIPILYKLVMNKLPLPGFPLLTTPRSETSALERGGCSKYPLEHGTAHHLVHATPFVSCISRISSPRTHRSNFGADQGNVPV